MLEFVKFCTNIWIKESLNKFLQKKKNTQIPLWSDERTLDTVPFDFMKHFTDKQEDSITVRKRWTKAYPHEGSTVNCITLIWNGFEIKKMYKTLFLETYGPCGVVIELLPAPGAMLSCRKARIEQILYLPLVDTFL